VEVFFPEIQEVFLKKDSAKRLDLIAVFRDCIAASPVLFQGKKENLLSLKVFRLEFLSQVFEQKDSKEKFLVFLNKISFSEILERKDFSFSCSTIFFQFQSHQFFIRQEFERKKNLR